ncbi:recombinase zinc beta ribbon domain-containing protein [Flavobacterium sp. W22_SRS_FP1]|uniref:recombinase zinc beta ribbon domain-containing protein n=1 Tax=Flavobacterium sp. W22_SRS_FP1 TaxID=3240276 RepID=UPI003F926EB2
MLGIYCRITKEKEVGKDRSIDEQKQSGIELANRLNLSYKIYVDEGVSGSLSIIKRPALNLLLDDIYCGEIHSIYVYDQSRLERLPEARSALKKVFKDENITLYNESGIVGTDIETEFQGDLLSVINNFQIKLMAKKIKAVLRRNLINGKVHSIPNYGYKKGIGNLMVIDEEQSEIVKRIYDLSLKGIGTNKIAELLNKDGIKTKYNLINKGTISVKNKYTNEITTRNKSEVKWNGGTIRNILTNTTYKGVRTFGGVDYSCPAIFEDIYWQKVNVNLKTNSNNSGKVATYNYLLKGLLRCGKCGRNYYGKTRADKSDHFYMCSSKRKKEDNCGNRSVNIDVLDMLIWNKFVIDGELLELIKSHYESLKNSDIVNELESEIKANLKELKNAEDDKSYFLELVLEKEIKREDIKSKMTEITTKINSKKNKIANLRNQLDSIVKSASEDNADLVNIPSLSFIDKVEVLKKYIKDIRIYYEKPNYYIEILFNIVNMENSVYLLKDNYKFAVLLPNPDLSAAEVLKAPTPLLVMNQKAAKEVVAHVFTSSVYASMFRMIKEVNYKFS